MIPKCCPVCLEQNQWKEKINPFTTGIPIGKHIRIALIVTRGFGLYKVTYHCQRCGFKGKYDYRDDH